MCLNDVFSPFKTLQRSIMNIATSLDDKVILSKLIAEHDHMRKTLNLLEMQFLDLCRDKMPDLSTMRSIVVYIQDYPEKAHHPLEDMIYSVLMQRETKVELLHNLVTDHNKLEEAARKLKDSLDLFISGGFSIDQLKKQLSSFLTKQRQHLYIEEMEIFPLTKRVLKSSDWEKIQSSISYTDNHAFGERTNNDYALLANEIENNNH